MNKSTIDFNTAYGDISFVGRDLELIRDPDQYLVQELIALFKSNKKDYPLFPKYGMDLESYIGRPVSEALAIEIQTAMIKKIQENRIYLGTIDIPYIIDKHTIHYRIMIPGMTSLNLSFLQEKGFEIE